MRRRDFVKKMPLAVGAVAGAGLLLPRAAGAARLDAPRTSRRGTLEVLNAHIKNVWFPHETPAGSDLLLFYHKYIQEGERQYGVFFTGFKPWPDSAMLSGQWLAYPTDPAKAEEWKHWYSNITITLEQLHTCSPFLSYTELQPPGGGAYSPGDVFNVRRPPQGGEVTELWWMVEDSLAWLERLLRNH